MRKMSLLSPPSISSSLAPYATLEDTARKRSRRARVCVCPRSVAIRLSRSAFNYPSTVRGEQEISRLRSLSLQPTRDDPIARFSIQSFEKSPISNTHPTDSRKRGGGEGDRRATSCLARSCRGAAGTTPRCRACRSPEALSIIIYLEA